MSGADTDLAIDLARHAVTAIAPEELPLFPATSEAYRRDPGAVEATAAGKDEVLGFGADALAALTPVALSVAGAVATFLLAQVRAVAQEESETAVRGMVRRLLGVFDRDDAPAAPPPLSADQLKRVRSVALERGRLLKLPDDQAQLLADAMVGGLVTS